MPMRALSTAATGMNAMQQEIDNISNNLANVQTTGFKKARGEFEDLLYQQLSQAGFSVSEQNESELPTGIQIGLGTRMVSTTKMHSQGSLKQTGRDLDAAIEGDGFFRVQLPNGRTGYTRDGSFHRDSEGNIVTSDGYIIQNDINIPENVTQVQISEDGRVEGFDPQNPQQVEELGQIETARFANPEGLKAIGNNLFVPTNASGDPIEGVPGQDGRGALRQGFLEESNVQAVKELTEMIETQRAFELNSNSIDAADQMLQRVNNLRR